MRKVCISGTGMHVPEHSVDNDTLVEVFNNHAKQSGAPESSSAFIQKASAIERRHLIDPEGVLDQARMSPTIPKRSDNELSFQAEFAHKAGLAALKNANISGEEIDCIIVSCTNIQRPYPGIAIEIQSALGAKNAFAFDMQVACSSATFGINNAINIIQTGQAKRCLILSPEICSTQVDFTNRDSHFIFGDAAAAVVVEAIDTAKTAQFEVMSTHLKTDFSNNIRCNFGFLNPVSESGAIERYFTQEGRKVFKEVTPLVIGHVTEHLSRHKLMPTDVSRYWLHQANGNMNAFIMKKLLDREPTQSDAPVILSEYGNTASAGSVLAFHLHSDIHSGQHGLLCSFGAGYSIGSILLKKI
ncbi:MAG: beta-ketoacyl-ACP synthase III [Legionellales bacterium]|nr:beta-ketoacyl-ACP synthase III [Legionellales bacterium]|tara:strand:- start:7 stop:1077 length:1071 start_codon:yes stop_codon:yes gene_type:complete